MNAEYSAIAELSNISFLSDVLISPYDIPPHLIRNVSPLDTKREDYDILSESDTGFKTVILKYLKEAEGFTVSRELVEVFNISECSVRRVLRQLEREELAISSLDGLTGRKRNTKFWIAVRKEKEA